MGFDFLPQFNAGDVPDVEDGMTDALFLGVRLVEHPDWAVESDRFGKPDDGKRLHFSFVLVDEEGAEIYPEEGEKPVELELKTRTASGERSNTYAAMKGILTAPELAAWQAGAAPKAEALDRRPVQLVISHNEKGYPNIDQVLPGRKALIALLAKQAKNG